LTQGLSLNHIPSFHYNHENMTGTFGNWGYGPSFTLAHPEGDYSTLPSMTFEDNGRNETVYLSGWHIHSPADHSVQGDRSKSELHLVHTDAKGHGRSVLAFRIDPGNQPSPFFSQMPELVSFRNKTAHVNATINHNLALQEVNRFQEFWTYKGSLTSPPCTEGVRWFVARNILFVSVEQMQAVLGVSIYSARAEQEVWLHQINV
jgi:carbonic anhydrase